jgi:hypothetical protein
MEVMRQTIQTGKNEPTTSMAGALAQPPHRRQTPPILKESVGVLFIVAGRPEVEWKKVELTKLEPWGRTEA